MVWSDALNANPPSDERYDEGSISDPWSLVFFCFIDGSYHEDANGHCPDPGIEGDEEIGSLIPSAVDKERRVRLGLGEPQCQQERGKPRIPSPRSLLQTIESVEAADHVRTTGVHKSCWLRAVDYL